MQYFQDVYGLRYHLSEMVVTDGSSLIGKQLDDIETAYSVRIIASKISGEANRIGPEVPWPEMSTYRQAW